MKEFRLYEEVPIHEHETPLGKWAGQCIGQIGTVIQIVEELVIQCDTCGRTDVSYQADRPPASELDTS